MYRTIVVPLDGSRLSEQALAYALTLAARLKSDVHVVHARTMTPPAENGGVDDPARDYLERLSAEAGARLGRPVSFALFPEALPDLLMPTPAPGTIAEWLCDYVREKRGDLIVMATHGRGGLSRLWFGSVAEALIRLNPSPLLLIRPAAQDDALEGWRADGPIRRILLPLDWTETSRAAIEPAAGLAAAFGASLTLFRVVPLPYTAYEPMTGVPLGPPIADLEALRRDGLAELEELAQTLRSGGTDARAHAELHASPARAILECARAHDSDLIVLATRARRGFDRVLLGSVADKVVRGTSRPVLVLRAPAEAAQEAG